MRSQMKRPAMAVLLSCAAAFAPAHAGEAADALSECLTKSATPEDRRDLVRWIFSAIAAHPDLDGLTRVDSAQREQAEVAAAAVFERLLAQDCPAQSRQAILQEGMEGYGAAFKTLGEIAMTDVVTHGDVQQRMTGMVERIDSQRVIQALLSE